MPSRNTLKRFEPESMYHVYNRGVDKRIIFVDEKDYAVFLSFLKYALLTDESHKATDEVDANDLSSSERFNIRREGFKDKIQLVAYCLMPNHFHLLFFQDDFDAITRLMRSVATGYSVYFNKRHKRTGPLYEGRYKASKINSQEYWGHISRYIHLNPQDIGRDYKKYEFSSYKNYVGQRKSEWVNPALVMDGFNNVEEYIKFMQDNEQSHKEIKRLLANSKELE